MNRLRYRPRTSRGQLGGASASTRLWRYAALTIFAVQVALAALVLIAVALTYFPACWLLRSLRVGLAWVVRFFRPKQEVSDPSSMTAVAPAGVSPDSIDFAYQVAADKLAAQLDTGDKIDSKLGVVIGAVVAIAALYATTAKTSIAALVLLVPAAAAARGYSSRDWANPPNPAGLAKYANLGKQKMQEQSLSIILAALARNDDAVKAKAGWFNWSLWLSLAAVVALILLTALLPKPM
jgi:hypothetical protein